MAHLQYFSYPGFGDYGRNDFHYNQAVRIDNRIEISGQGGWNPDVLPPKIYEDLVTEVDQTFANVDRALRTAGGQGWSQVYKVRAFVTTWDDEMVGRLIHNFRKWCPDHMPIYTIVGTTRLGIEGMRLEVEVEAHLG